MKKRHALVLLCLFVVCTISAQSVRLFTNERDLSNSLISDVYQDKKGFVWISTEDGLNRFDGSKMKVYRYVKGDEYSLPSSFVELVYQTKEGVLLVACKNGLVRYTSVKLEVQHPRPLPPSLERSGKGGGRGRKAKL